MSERRRDRPLCKPQDTAVEVKTLEKDSVGGLVDAKPRKARLAVVAYFKALAKKPCTKG